MGKIFFALSLLFASTVAKADSFEIGWDRPGLDYYNYEMNNPREILCQWKCQQDGRCRAWTFVKPGIQGKLARCWLKHAVPKAVRNSCCTSGYIGRAEDSDLSVEDEQLAPIEDEDLSDVAP